MKKFLKILVIIVAIPIVAIAAWFGYVSYQHANFKHPLLQTSFEDFPENVRYANEVLQTFALELEKEHEFFLNGFNLEKDQEKIDVLNFQVTASYSPSLEEARALELALTQRLIEMVNKNEKLRPFLKEYPVSNQSVSIDLRFHGSNITSFDSHVSSIHTIPNSNIAKNRNRIFYRGDNDPFGREFEFSETFDEAKNALNSEINPFVHQPTELEEAIEAVVISVTESLWNKLKLYENSILYKKGEEELRCEFTCTAPADQDHARHLLVTSVNKLTEEMNRNEKLIALLNNHHFKSDQIKFKLCFRKHKALVGLVHFDRGIDSVVLENDEITYYPNRTNFESPKISSESYSEALTMAKNYHPSLWDRIFKNLNSLLNRICCLVQEAFATLMFSLFA